MQKINFIRGSSFLFSGAATNNAAVDFSGWSISAAIFAKSQNGNEPQKVADLEARWISAAAGTVAFSAPTSDTAAWPRGTATMQISMVSPLGEAIKSTVLIVQIFAEGELA